MTDASQTSTPWYPSLPWDERWGMIKEALHAQGLSLTRLQKERGVTGVATVKDKRYPAAQKAIAEALGVVPAALFPERYDIQWDAHYQAEAVKALPGLRGVNTAAQGRASRLEVLHTTYREIPVDLMDLPTDMLERSKWVKEKLKERGFNLSEVAAHLGVKRATFYNIGKVAYSEVQNYLASCLGVEPQEIWPERYSPDGKPLASGRRELASPNRHSTPYELYLSDGLWLPMSALAGLPGMAASAKAVRHTLLQKGVGTRVRDGVDEVAYSALPAETRRFLTGESGPAPASDPDKANAYTRQRRRTMAHRIEYRDVPDDQYDYTLQIDLLRGLARVAIVCVDVPAERIFNCQGVDLSAAELRKTASAMIEAAQALEIACDAHTEGFN